MGTKKSLLLRFNMAQQHIPAPILVIVVPFLGLIYIVVFPFIGIAALILASGYRAKQMLANR